MIVLMAAWDKEFTFMLQVSYEGRKEGNSYGVEKEF